MKIKLSVAIFLGVALVCATSAQATSVAPRKASNYGQGDPNPTSNLEVESSTSYDGDNGVNFTELLVCSTSANASCPGNFTSDGSDYSLILEITSAVPSGTEVAINGLTGFDPTTDLVGEVTCDTTAVNNLPCVTAANAACETALGASAASAGSLALPAACLLDDEVLYIDFSSDSSSPNFVEPTVTPATAAPEPGTLLLAVAGILGVLSRRRVHA